MEKKIKNLRFPCQCATKVDLETLDALDDIALYEKMARATLVRNILIEKMRVYERNPAFKRFKALLEQQREKRR